MFSTAKKGELQFAVKAAKSEPLKSRPALCVSVGGNTARPLRQYTNESLIENLNIWLESGYTTGRLLSEQCELLQLLLQNIATERWVERLRAALYLTFLPKNVTDLGVT